MKAKRILWILSHKEIMDFEVPLLRKMGYEVYIPKKLPFETNAVTDFKSDSLLTIPPKDIDKLNAIDFYNSILLKEQGDLINKYFSIAMFTHYPLTVESMVDRFNGMLVMRAFGLHDGEGTYTDAIISKLGIGYFRQIEALGSRFVFGESNKGISRQECEFFKNHALYMPIGLSDVKAAGTSVKADGKMLFVCPEIKFTPYYENLYASFKKDFEKIPCTIGGEQPVAVTNDPRISGRLEERDYLSHRCMYYPITDRYHLTYPPLRAIQYGVPLIFLAGGILDKLGGKNLPGRCKNTAEAKSKIKRIIKGDKRLAKRIAEEQKILLKKFTAEYCYPIWEKAINQIEEQLKYKSVPLFGRKREKLCIMLSEGYTGGVLDYTIRLTEAVKRGAEDAGDDLDIVFAHIDHPIYLEHDYFKPIRDMGIPIRKFSWKGFDPPVFADMMRLMGVKYDTKGEIYYMANDGADFFADCDRILLTVDRVPRHTVFMQPFGLVAHDYIQRINPLIIPVNYIETEVLSIARNSKAIFTCTPVTFEHAVQYAGADKRRVHMIPVPFSVMKGLNDEETDKRPGKKKYFLWSTNAAIHKNQILTLEALSLYYAFGGTLQCVVTGVNTQLFSPNVKIKNDDPQLTSHIKKIRDMITLDPALKSNIKCMGNLPKIKYRNVLKNAEFFVHPGSADNGNGTAFDAAYLGVPTLSNDYEAMRYYDKYFDLNMTFFDISDPEELAKTLLFAERNSDVLRSKLPSPEHMESLTVSSPAIYKPLYADIKSCLALKGDEC